MLKDETACIRCSMCATRCPTQRVHDAALRVPPRAPGRAGPERPVEVLTAWAMASGVDGTFARAAETHPARRSSSSSRSFRSSTSSGSTSRSAASTSSGSEIWLDEWTLIWLALMFAMWLIGARRSILGRVYCAYACPQMVFSEFAHDLDALAKRIVRKISANGRGAAVRAVSLALLGARLGRLLRPFHGVLRAAARGRPAARALRRRSVARSPRRFSRPSSSSSTSRSCARRFCRSVCPYGLLQGMLEDGRSLHVTFDEATGPCIQCNLCAKVCPMEIDIRNGPYQIECTRCGNCIDACNLVLGKKKRPGLLAFDFGEREPDAVGRQARPRRRVDGRVRRRARRSRSRSGRTSRSASRRSTWSRPPGRPSSPSPVSSSAPRTRGRRP